MGFIVFFIGVLVLVWEIAKREENKKEREARGTATRPECDPQQHSKNVQDVYKDWEKERKFFPKEYIPYLEKNSRALGEYVVAYANKIEHDAGYLPYLSPIAYDQRNYNPFHRFEYYYKWKIKEYNENGEYYY